MIYTIIDVETTGQTNKITEISIFKYDGDKIIDEFTSLVNPQSLIPDYITALTGINNSMLVNAPTFSEIANTIFSITENTVFVAHNVNFDYNIIRNEFKVLNIDFTRKKLCTVRLSRKLFPGFKSYSLGKLCKSLSIDIKDRHRAKGDAEATVILFKMLLDQENSEIVFNEFLTKVSKEATLPSHLPTSIFNNLPSIPGVYYFKNKKGKIIYVGKAKDIKKRVLSHFYSKTKKSLDMCRETHDIDFELSGSEFIALLMEDAAIKHNYPEYNLLSKRSPKSFAIFSYTDRNGIIHLAYNTVKAAPNPILVLFSINQCRAYLEQVCNTHELCPKYCHLQEGVSVCSHYKIKACKGICSSKEDYTSYNQRVLQAITELKNNSNNLIIKQNGRNNNENGFVVIKEGVYLGYGFIDKTEQIINMNDLEPYLIPQKDNADIQKIIRSKLVNSIN